MAYIGAGINQTKTSVENSKDEFFSTYYGQAATDPTVDPLGNAIDDGDLFYNTTEDALKIRVGGEWFNLRTSTTGYQQLTATAGQTTFDVSGSYTPGFVFVTLNGVVLASGDYDDSSGTEIILTDGAAEDDIVGIYIFDTFSVSDTVSASSGGTFSGAVTFSDSVDVSSATFTVANDQISGDAINGGTATPTTLNSTNLNVDSGTLFVDSTNNLVGVGTSSPGGTLAVNNDTDTRIRFEKNENFVGDIGQFDSTDFVFRSNTDFGFIPNSGNFSVGTRTLSVNSGGIDVNGALSKNSGSFKIDHPLPEKSETHYLVHSFVESPLADNIYRGTTTLTDGVAQVNIDAYVGMTEGTFSALNGNPQIFLQNESGFEPLKGHVTDNILHIQCRDETSTDTISWMVVAERQDQHMLDTQWTDEFGRPVLEPEKNLTLKRKNSTVMER